MNNPSYDSQFLLKNLMDNMEDCIYFKDLESKFIFVNSAMAQWMGCKKPAEVIGKSDFDIYREENAQRMFEAEQAIIKTGESLEGIEEKEEWKEGRMAWVSTTKLPLRDATGKIMGTFGVSRDITAQKESEQQAAYYARQIQRIKEEMEEEIRMAAELQKTFFPHSYPKFPKGCNPSDSAVSFLHYYQASEWVSGDFCAVRRISDSESGILLCDVMGHGVRAALGTAIIYAMVKELMEQERNPAHFLQRLNRLLLPVFQQEDSFMFATACYAIFDSRTGKLRVASAGHPPPIHLDRKAQKTKWLFSEEQVCGPALALFEEAEYSSVELSIQPGDGVLLYTDGIYEAANANDEEFGEDRLLETAQHHVHLKMNLLFPALMNAAEQFSEQTFFDDDVCLLGFDYRHPMEKKDG